MIDPLGVVEQEEIRVEKQAVQLRGPVKVSKTNPNEIKVYSVTEFDADPDNEPFSL